MDGPRYVVREEVDDLVVPVEDLEDGLLPLSDLPTKMGYLSLVNNYWLSVETRASKSWKSPLCSIFPKLIGMIGS